MNKHLKLILVLLVLALTVTALAITVGASGTDTEPALSIKNLSISLENAIFMNFKVESTGINDPNTIELLLWKNVPEEYKKGSEDVVLSADHTEAESGYEVFKYTDLAAKNMTEYVYVCAYASIDGKDVYSAPAKFSIAMYAYMQKHAANPDAELVALIDGMLDYGALAQTYFKYNTEFLANETTYQIRVTNGLLEDNFALGWYFEGQSFTLTANSAPDGKVFSHWENSAGENIGDSEVLECTATKVDTYTAVYKDDTRIPESSEGLDFSLNADGESYTVTGLGSCTDTDIVITSYKGLPVTAIGKEAFKAKGITGVIIGDSVTSIGERAFSHCSSLTSVIIGDSVTSIGSFAFEYCSSLTRVTIGNSVTSIDSDAFYYCTSLTSVTIPNSITSIGSYAFSGCYKLVEVINLSSLNITAGSDSYGYVGYYVKEVHNGESKIVNYSDYLFYTYSGVNYLLGYVGSDTELVLPENYNGEAYEIYKYAFYKCTSLTSVTIGNSVTSIGNYAFYECTSLTSVNIGNSVTSIGERAFYNCTRLTSVTIPDSVTSIDPWAFADCSSLTSVTIPDSVTSISGHTFYGCTSLTSVTIPNSVTSIGNYAFAYCTSLTSVVIPDGVTSIGDLAFRNCTNLTSVIIPDSVTSIGNFAFSYCTSLTSVIIGDSVTYIDEGVFYGCSSLTIYCEAASQPSGWNSNWNASNCPVVWGYKAEAESSEGLDFSLNADGESYTVTGLGSCTDTEIVIGTYKGLPVTAIGSSAFSSKGITGVIIGDSVTSIGYHAFYNCDSLKSVTIGNSVTSIGESAFYNCDSLKSVTIPDSVTSIGYSAFSDCTSLTSVIIGNSVTSIGSDAFAGCSSLTSVIIPDSVTYVGEWAFAYCSSLTIYCEAACQPSVWHSYWNYSNCPVVWI